VISGVEMYYSKHVKHAGIRGSGGHAPRKFLKIDAKILNIFTHYTHVLLRYNSSACVNGKVLVGSDNHIIIILSKAGIWRILYFSGGLGCKPQKLQDFCNLRALIIKLDNVPSDILSKTLENILNFTFFVKLLFRCA